MIDIIFFFICCIGSSLVFAMGFFLGRRPAKPKPSATEVRKLVLTPAQTLEAAKLYDAATNGTEHKHYHTVRLWQYLCELLPGHMRNEVMELNTTDCHRQWSILVTLPVGFPTEAEWKAKKVEEAAKCVVEQTKNSILWEPIAKEFATKYHAGQFRRDGVTPYISHSAAVANCFTSDIVRSIAWLHDVLEDTDADIGDLEAVFPADIVNGVLAITKHDGQSYDSYLKQVAANPLAKIVKIQDIRHNLSDQPSDRQIQKYAVALEALEKSIWKDQQANQEAGDENTASPAAKPLVADPPALATTVTPNELAPDVPKA